MELFLVIKSPKQRLETYCFCSVSSSYYYYNNSPPFFLSVAHELVHGRSQELLDRISWNLVELCGKEGQSNILRGSNGIGVTIESYGKVEILYINVDNFYMDNDRDIQFDIVIGHH